ncbi:MAG: hypothetical protein ACLF0P_12055 [Thermoanaerobaculia bacterium]
MILWRSPTVRAAFSLAGLSTWMVLLFAGWIGGGAVHLLFLASLALFPWRALAAGPAAQGRTDTGAPQSP